MSDNLLDGIDAVYHAGPEQSGQREYTERQLRLQVERMHASVEDWRPPELPDLSLFDEVFLDHETSGLRWWDQDRIIGTGLLTPDGVSRYLPIRHKVGPNIPEEQYFDWCRRELRGKRVVNIRTKFDLHMFRADGIDLEAQGCTFGDVAHYAALLDDHRKRFNQEDLALAYLASAGLLTPEECKVKTSHGYVLDPRKFAEYPAGLVAPRAESDVRIVQMLQSAMWPALEAQGLQRVRALEDSVIPVVVEMEHNGAPIDVETLHRWVTEVQTALAASLWNIKRLTNISLASPTAKEDVWRLFAHLNIPRPRLEDPKTGKIRDSIADQMLAPIEHPAIQELRKAIALASLLSKFLLKYERSTLRDGILRYELHQLPYQNDDEGHGGAVSGRFSSAAPSRDEGANIQQVIGVKNQLGPVDKSTGQHTGFTKDWIIKKLFKPRRGVWMKADASQFQFRLFAHYANSPKLIEAYQRDRDWRGIEARGEKLTDFHEVVQNLIVEYAKKELNRTHTKNVNFAQVFGAGVRKMAAQIGVPADQIPAQDEDLETGGPLFQEVVQLSATYHEMFPEVKPLLRLTGHLAQPEHSLGKHQCGRACRAFYAQGYEHRGWVRTIDGRRARFDRGDRFYSALNRIIQGTEGDVNKRVLVAVHNLRQELGLTPLFTVHDELDAELHDPQNLMKVKEILNTQYYDFAVPILWEAGIGPSWAEAK